MKYYELMILTIHKDSKFNIINFIDYYKEFIKSLKDSKILLLKYYGIQKLAFPIKKHKKANFILINIVSTVESLLKIEQNLKFNDYVIRILITKIKKSIFKKNLYDNSKIKLNTIFNLYKLNSKKDKDQENDKTKVKEKDQDQDQDQNQDQYEDQYQYQYQDQELDLDLDPYQYDNIDNIN